jgi:hypothetical protein
MTSSGIRNYSAFQAALVVIGMAWVGMFVLASSSHAQSRKFMEDSRKDIEAFRNMPSNPAPVQQGRPAQPAPARFDPTTRPEVVKARRTSG